MNAATGLLAFPITPASPEGRVDTEALARLVRPLAEASIDAIGLLGSTGTYAYLDRTERRRAVEAARAAVGERVPLLVGVGALRTDAAVRLAQDARGAGAAMGLIAPVSYTPLGEEEVFTHIAAIARGSGLPLCLYDNPATTHFGFTPGLVGRLARVEGVVALKSPAPASDAIAAHHAALRAAVPEGFPVGYSGDWHAADALIAGGAAWYSVLAGLFPAPCRAILHAARAGDAAGARRLSADLEPLWALFRAHSSLRVMYAAAGHRGLCEAPPPLPILPLPEPVRREVGRIIDRLALA